jgi:hypothetical protein
VEAPTRPAVITRPYAEYTIAAVFLRTRLATNQRYPLRSHTSEGQMAKEVL